MSFVTTRPDSIGETAANLHEIGVTMSAHDDGVTPLITNVESPAHDLVSIVTSMLFSMHGELYKAIARHPRVICPNTSDQQDFVLAHRISQPRGHLHLDSG